MEAGLFRRGSWIDAWPVACACCLEAGLSCGKCVASALVVTPSAMARGGRGGGGDLCACASEDYRQPPFTCHPPDAPQLVVDGAGVSAGRRLRARPPHPRVET